MARRASRPAVPSRQGAGGPSSGAFDDRADRGGIAGADPPKSSQHSIRALIRATFCSSALTPRWQKYSDSKIQNLYRRLAGTARGASRRDLRQLFLGRVIERQSLDQRLARGRAAGKIVRGSGYAWPRGRIFLRRLRIPLLGGRAFTPQISQQAAQAAAAVEIASQEACEAQAPAIHGRNTQPRPPPIPVMVNARLCAQVFRRSQNPLGKRSDCRATAQVQVAIRLLESRRSQESGKLSAWRATRNTRSAARRSSRRLRSGHGRGRNFRAAHANESRRTRFLPCARP